jgi:hypothetical protein
MEHPVAVPQELKKSLAQRLSRAAVNTYSIEQDELM